MSISNNPFESRNFYDNSQTIIPQQNTQIPLYKRFQQQQTQRTNIQQSPLIIQQTQSSIQQLPISTVIPIQIPTIMQQSIENQSFFEQSISITQTNQWNDLQQVNVFPNIPNPTFTCCKSFH